MGDLYRDVDIVAVKKALGRYYLHIVSMHTTIKPIIIAHFHDFSGSVKPRTRHQKLRTVLPVPVYQR